MHIARTITPLLLITSLFATGCSSATTVPPSPTQIATSAPTISMPATPLASTTAAEPTVFLESEPSFVSTWLVAIHASSEWLPSLERHRQQLPNPLLLTTGQYLMWNDQGWQSIQLTATETDDLVAAVLGPDARLCRDIPMERADSANDDHGVAIVSVYHQAAPCQATVRGTTDHHAGRPRERWPATEEGQQRMLQFNAANEAMRQVSTTFAHRIEPYRASVIFLAHDPVLRRDVHGYLPYEKGNDQTRERPTPQPWPFTADATYDHIIAGDEAAAILDFAWKPTLITVGDQTLWVIAMPSEP